MSWQGSLIALIALPLAVAVCAKDSVKQSGCKRFQFEDEVAVYIRSDSVKTLNALLEFGAPRHIISMELELPDEGRQYTLKEVHLSAFFRPLQTDAVECQDSAETGTIRCYADLLNASMQVSAVFDRSSQIDFPTAMREVAVQVERTALNCD